MNRAKHLPNCTTFIFLSSPCFRHRQYWIGKYSEHVFINVFYFNFISYNMLSNTNINNTRQYHLQQYCVQSYCNGLLIWLKLGFYLCFDFFPLSNYKLKVKKGILNRLDLNMLIRFAYKYPLNRYFICL